MKCSSRRTLGSLALVIFLFTPLARGQSIITTVAGNAWILRGDGGPATGAPLSEVSGVAVDAAGNIYASEQYHGIVVKISPNGTLKVVAGKRTAGLWDGDGRPATLTSLWDPSGIAVDTAGNIYIADTKNNRVRKVTPAGIITTVAGNGIGPPPYSWELSGDGGPATAATLRNPSGVAVDTAGNLYVAAGGAVRAVSPSGIINTVAGNGVQGFSGDGGPATSASLDLLGGVAVDAAGNIYIADLGNNRVRKVSASGIISTVAGNGVRGLSGDGGPATSASLSEPGAVAVDAAGNLYIAGNNVIRMVDASGVISTVAGNGVIGFSGDGGPATGASLYYASGVAVDAAGNVYIADSYNGRVRKVSPSGIISTLAGNGNEAGDGGPATCAYLHSPSGVAVDAAGNLYIVDSWNGRVRKVSSSGIISTVAGGGSASPGDGGPATSALLKPWSVAVDAGGNLYIADTWSKRIRKVSPSGLISTVAGGGPAYPGDRGPATSVSLSGPAGVAVDAAGNLYIADGNRVRKVSSSGIISTVAGNGESNFSGDGGPATWASLNGAVSVAVDAAGNLYIADWWNKRVRKVSAAGIISTVAGTGTSTWLNQPASVAVDAAGNLYIADSGYNQVSRVSASGVISTVAAEVPLYEPSGIALDAAGNLYIADTRNNIVRKVLAGPPAGPQISSAGVTNAASFWAGFTPGSIVTIFGVGIARNVSGVLPATSLPLPTSLSGISVSVGGMPAPLFAVANVGGQEQINLQVPYEITGLPTVSIQVNANSVLSNTIEVTVLQAHPGIFTVDGAAGAILHGASSALVTASNPAARNEVITIYATGLGPVSPAPKTGYPAPTAEPLARTAVTPAVTTGGVSAPVLFSGLAPGFVALYQVNVQVPAGTPSGVQPLQIIINGVPSNFSTIVVK